MKSPVQPLMGTGIRDMEEDSACLEAGAMGTQVRLRRAWGWSKHWLLGSEPQLSSAHLISSWGKTQVGDSATGRLSTPALCPLSSCWSHHKCPWLWRGHCVCAVCFESSASRLPLIAAAMSTWGQAGTGAGGGGVWGLGEGRLRGRSQLSLNRPQKGTAPAP